MSTNPTDAERLAEREAQIRECMSRRIYLAPDQAMLLRFLDGRDAEIATLRAERDRMRERYHAALEQGMEVEKERDAARAEVERLRELFEATRARGATPPTTDDVERARFEKARSAILGVPVWRSESKYTTNLAVANDIAHAVIKALAPLDVVALSAAREQGRAPLFVDGEFTAHSGGTLPFKIDCDALTDTDLATLAADAARRFPRFCAVEGVPRGGLRFADSLRQYATGSPLDPMLIVDDVLTTGASMEEARGTRRDVFGIVIFARGHCPDWITPLFGDYEQSRAEGAREMRERVLKRIADFGSGHAVTIAAAIRSLPEDSQ